MLPSTLRLRHTSRRLSARAIATSCCGRTSFFSSDKNLQLSDARYKQSRPLSAAQYATGRFNRSTLNDSILNETRDHSNLGKIHFQPIRPFSAETLDGNADVEGSTGRQVPYIRNVAIVAHVDHGKTTIVDELLRCASESGGVKGVDLVMDCGDLERERGITITSKVTRLDYHQDGMGEIKIINVVDTVSFGDVSVSYPFYKNYPTEKSSLFESRAMLTLRGKLIEY